MIEAEVPYACRAEFCEHAEDFIARRTRLAFLDTSATEQALPRVGPHRCITNSQALPHLMKLRFLGPRLSSMISKPCLIR